MKAYMSSGSAVSFGGRIWMLFLAAGGIQVSGGHIWIGSSGLGSVHSVARREIKQTIAVGAQ